jgi:hypothetical protein
MPKDSYGFAGRFFVFFTALSCSSSSETTPWEASGSSLEISVIRDAMESSKMTDEDRLMSEDEDSLLRFRCGGSTCC